MAYATLSHVQNWNPLRWSATPGVPKSPFTGSMVTDYLNEIAGEIGAKLLACQYSLPIPTTATIALAKLESLNSLGAAMRMEQAAPAAEKREDFEKMYESALKMLCDNLLDAPKNVNTALPRAPSAPTPFISRDTVL